jgi:hypothetical protein
LVAPFVLGQTVDINEDDWGKTENYVECCQHIEKRSDALGVAEGNAVAAHEASVEELMHFKRQEGANYHQRVWMAFVLLYKLLVTLISLHDY